MDNLVMLPFAPSFFFSIFHESGLSGISLFQAGNIRQGDEIEYCQKDAQNAKEYKKAINPAFRHRENTFEEGVRSTLFTRNSSHEITGKGDAGTETTFAIF
ncbi:MAG: hypothetical protein ABSB32_16640 [Thermodesulfobacteriota bacterium]